MSTAIPSLPPLSDPQLRQFLTAIKENLEVRTRQRGSPLDASPTFQDLLDSGILKIKDGITSIGGRQYTAAQLMGLVETSIPNWITSDTAPPAPAGLVVSTDATNTLLAWTESGFDTYAETQIWRSTSNNLSTAQKVGSTSGNTYTDGLPVTGSVYYYWIRDVAQNGLVGPFNDVNGAATSYGPSAPAISTEFIGFDVEFSWPTPTSNLYVTLYKLEYQDESGAWLPLDLASGNSYRLQVSWAGSRNFRVAAVDINGNVGPFSTKTVTVTAAAAPVVSVGFDGEQVILTWADPVGSLPVDRYEVYDSSISSATLLSTLYATTFRTKVTWLNKTLLVRAIDSAGKPGAARSVQVSISTGKVYSQSVNDKTFKTEVIDNNVLFRWKNQPGSLPISHYNLYRGDAFASATLIGAKDGGFTTVFEAPQTQSVYTYWLTAVDTAGNEGTPSSASATVNQPPDYVLATNFISSFAGTKTNCIVEGANLVAPVNTAETFAGHFTSRSWAGPSDQVTAGYPVFIQPGALTATYTETFDYGATLVAMKMTASWLLQVLGGSVTVTPTLTAALDSGFTQNVQVFNGDQGYAINFRYVRLTITITATDDKGVAALSNLSVKLDTKLKSLTGSLYANASDSGGTTVYLTDTKLATGSKTFIDVESITVAAQGTAPLYAIYDFVDAYNPLSFKVLLFNSSGARVSGNVSYSVKGY